MSYTTVEQVRNHLVANSPIQEAVVDQPISLWDSAIRFHSSPIQDGTLVVKSLRSRDHTRLSVVLGPDATTFSSVPVVRGSVVVAGDSSCGTMYIENRDFVIDYNLGKITVKSGGSLEAGQTAVIWFLGYSLLESGEDYHVDLELGQIRRLAGGAIAAGECVLLDYVPVYADFTEQILVNAVAEANGLIEREVDPTGEFGADPALALAATYRALDIVCRVAAGRELSCLRASSHVAETWLKLAEGYSNRADHLISTFRPPIAGPACPTKG